jgi:hypothetical protein
MSDYLRPKRLQDLAPHDLRYLTYGAVDPVENVKTGARQAVEKTGKDAMSLVNAVRDFPRIKLKWGLGFLIPDAAKDEMEKKYLEKPEIITQKY